MELANVCVRPPVASLSFVTAGLDLVVHAEVRLAMDCRIKFGNDDVVRRANEIKEHRK
jgi:hypothetical protein